MTSSRVIDLTISDDEHDATKSSGSRAKPKASTKSVASSRADLLSGQHTSAIAARSSFVQPDPAAHNNTRSSSPSTAQNYSTSTKHDKRTAKDAFGRDDPRELLRRAEAEFTGSGARFGSPKRVKRIEPVSGSTPGRTSIEDLLAGAPESPVDDDIVDIARFMKDGLYGISANQARDQTKPRQSISLLKSPVDAAPRKFVLNGKPNGHAAPKANHLVSDQRPTEKRLSSERAKEKRWDSSRNSSAASESKLSFPQKTSLESNSPNKPRDNASERVFTDVDNVSNSRSLAAKNKQASLSNDQQRPNTPLIDQNHRMRPESPKLHANNVPITSRSSLVIRRSPATSTGSNKAHVPASLVGQDLRSPLLASPRSFFDQASPPRTPGLHDLPPLEGLGTSPRLVKLRSRSPKDGPSPSKYSLPPQDVQSNRSNGNRSAPGLGITAPTTLSLLDSTDSVRPSIEIADTIKVAPPMGTFRSTPPVPRPMKTAVPPAPPRESVQSSSRVLVGRKFDTTNLNSRVGSPWTDAEVLIAAYLFEVVGLPWGVVDKRMGRSYNTCATKYCRVPSGLKNPETKDKMRWPERKRAIDALVGTIDLDLEALVTHLATYIETASLPAQAAEEFKRLSALQPTGRAPPVAILHDRIEASNSPRSTPVSGCETLPTIATTRRRRGMVDESSILPEGQTRARVRPAEGHFDLKAMTRRRDSSPDSLLVSDQDDVLQVQVQAQPIQQGMRLFDLSEVDDEDEDMDGLYIQRKRPYLSRRERLVIAQALQNEPEAAQVWSNTTLHQDFSSFEVRAVLNAMRRRFPQDMQVTQTDRPTKAMIAAATALAARDARLRDRTRRSIRSFFEDFVAGQTPRGTRTQLRIQLAVPVSPRSESVPPAKHILNRELGVGLGHKSARRELRNNVFDTMAMTRTWTGASGDVGSLAWSPDGTSFAAAAACLVDTNSMQYNEPNNLLFGNLEQNTLYELPYHHRVRQKPAEGVNATHSMHVSQDPRLFETVSMVDFSKDGDMMFSVGFDDHLRAYSMNGDRGNVDIVAFYDHRAKIDLLGVNKHHNVLATGSQLFDDSVKVFSLSPDAGFQTVHSYSSQRARELIDKKIYPSALKWGSHRSVSKYLLGGFLSADFTKTISAYGHICLWDVEKNTPVQVAPAAGNTFDVAWESSSSRFMTACSAYGTHNNRGTKSVVRIFNALQDAGNTRWSSRGLEMECPALDINDVLFNPYNNTQVAAGATDGTVYVWDTRRPDEILHRFVHGTPLQPLDEHRPREELDTGVKFCAWGDRAQRLYTGSSDGVLKIWDTTRATTDAHVRDIETFNSGIYSGAFTNDFSKLLIGEVNGSINLLEGGADTKPKAEIEKFTLQPFEVADYAIATLDAQEGADSGVAAARTLVRDGKIAIRPMGGFPKMQAIQGHAYDGPYHNHADTPLLREEALYFQRKLAPPATYKPCALKRCAEAGKHFASEEIEDSERSSDRIPQAMRDMLQDRGSKHAPLTALKCTHCASSARVRDDDLSQAAFPLCERCSFCCFRCGSRVKLSYKLDVVKCNVCGGQWVAGALGYRLEQSPRVIRQKVTKTVAIYETKEGIPLDENSASGTPDPPARTHHVDHMGTYRAPIPDWMHLSKDDFEYLIFDMPRSEKLEMLTAGSQAMGPARAKMVQIILADKKKAGTLDEGHIDAQLTMAYADLQVESKKRVKALDMVEEKPAPVREGGMGDLLDLVQEWHHSLWGA